jgi:DNA-binding CsgD family transcriptional regulator
MTTYRDVSPPAQSQPSRRRRSRRDSELELSNYLPDAVRRAPYAHWVRLTWPLTGRSEELRSIQDAISDRDTSGVLICGAAGVGKSRLAREALALAASEGREIRWAVGSASARALPLAAFAPWAGTVAADDLQLVRGVIEALTSPAGNTPVVIGVDDVHLLDDLSTFALLQIIQRDAAKVVLTLRDGEPVTPATQELWRGGELNRLDLQPLAAQETTALVSASLGGSVDSVAAERLWELTRGNVLYLRNIVEQEVADARLAPQHGYWRWTGDPTVPPGLVELIESRMGALPEGVTDVIDALAVGEPLELAVLRTITDPHAVEEADKRGLITVETSGRRVEVRVAHPMYGEVRRSRAAPTRLRRLRGLVANALAGCDDGDETRTVVRRATLSLDADLAPDPELFTRAARGASWLADLPLVDRLADAAVRAGAGPEANIVRGRALTWLGRGEEGDDAFAGIDLDDLSHEDRARVAFLRAGNTLWALQDPPGAKRIIDAAAACTPPGRRGCIDAFLAVYWFTQGKPAKVLERWRHLALDELPAIVRSEVPCAVTYAAAVSGCVAEAVATAEVGYDVTSHFLDAAHARFVIGDMHVTALVLAGHIEAATRRAESLGEEAADLHGGVELISRGVAALAALGAGRLADACSLAQPVADALLASGMTTGFYPFGYRYQIPRTIALAMRGLTDEAVATFATLDHQRFPTWMWTDWQRRIAEAWVYAAQGARSDAIAAVMAAAETARANGQFAVEVLCLQTATQFGDPSCAARLSELATFVEGPRVRLAARFAGAVHAGDAAELVSVSEEFETMGDMVAAVDAAAHAAITYRRQGSRGSAFGASTRASALAEQCGADTPALRTAVTERLPLSDREREIVALLGAGLSCRAVAERLCLSIRTVEGHIYRAMNKTGTTNREQLVALLPRRSRN